MTSKRIDSPLLTTARAYRPASLTVLALALLAACGSERSPHYDEELDADVAPTMGRADAGPGQVSSEAGMPSFAVDLRADRVTLCPGECAELSVDVVRGQAGELAYAWNEGLPGSASQRVCPTASTRYTVGVRGSMASGEFRTEQTAEDSLTVDVRDCTKQTREPELCQVRHRFERSTSGNQLRATKPWVQNSGGNQVESTEDGSVYWTASFGVRLDLGADVLEATAAMEGFVHKLDAACKPVWTRALRATNPGDVMVMQAVATDPAGNVYAAGVGGPLLDFNPLLPVPIGFVSELVIHKLSPSGETLYRTRFAVGPTFVSHLAVDGQGRAYVAALVNSLTDLGTGPVGLSPSTFQTVLLALDEQGKRRGLLVDTGASQIETTAQQVSYGRYNDGRFDVLSSLLGLPPLAGYEPALVALGQGDLSAQWKNVYPFQDKQPYSFPLGIAGERQGVLVALMAESRTERLPTENVHTYDVGIVRFDAQGQLAHRTPLNQFVTRESTSDAGVQPDDGGVAAAVESFPGVNLVKAHARGGLAVAGTYVGHTRLGAHVLVGPKPPSLSDANELLVFEGFPLFVARADTADDVKWVHALDWGASASWRGLSLDAAGNVTVAGEAQVRAVAADAAQTSPSSEYDVIIERLRAD